METNNSGGYGNRKVIGGGFILTGILDVLGWQLLASYTSVPVLGSAVGIAAGLVMCAVGAFIYSKGSSRLN